MPVPTRPLTVNGADDDVAVSAAGTAWARAVTNDVPEGNLLPGGSPGAGAVWAAGPGAVAGLHPAGLNTAHHATRHPALQAAAATLGAWARLLPELGRSAPGAVACRTEAGSGMHGDEFGWSR